MTYRHAQSLPPLLILCFVFLCKKYLIIVGVRTGQIQTQMKHIFTKEFSQKAQKLKEKEKKSCRRY